MAMAHPFPDVRAQGTRRDPASTPAARPAGGGAVRAAAAVRHGLLAGRHPTADPVRRSGGLRVRGDARLLERPARRVRRLAGLRQRSGRRARDARRRRRGPRGRVPRRSARRRALRGARRHRGVQPGDGPDPADGDRHRCAYGGAGGECDGAVDDRRRGPGTRRSGGCDHLAARQRRRRHQWPRPGRPGDRRSPAPRSTVSSTTSTR